MGSITKSRRRRRGRRTDRLEWIESVFDLSLAWLVDEIKLKWRTLISSTKQTQSFWKNKTKTKSFNNLFSFSIKKVKVNLFYFSKEQKQDDAADDDDGVFCFSLLKSAHLFTETFFIWKKVKKLVNQPKSCFNSFLLLLFKPFFKSC